MNELDVKDLEKEARKRKRIASEWASRLHDLVEDRLWSEYTDLPAVAQSTFEACQAWAEAERAWKASHG